MKLSSGRCGVLTGVVVLLAASGLVRAATFSLKAVRVNNTDIAPTLTVDAMPGDRVIAHVFVRGWNEDVPGDRVTTVQVTVEGKENFFVQGLGNLNVAQPGCYDIPGPIFCETDLDCVGLASTPVCVNNLCRKACTPGKNPDAPDDECTASHPFCAENLVCVGANHDPDMCSLVDASQPDWLYAALAPGAVISACSFLGLNVACGSTVLNGIPPQDPGTERYVATVAIDLAADQACGSIVPEIAVGNENGIDTSFLILAPSGTTVFFPGTENLTINVIDANMDPVPCVGCSELRNAVPSNCTVDARLPNSLSSGIPAFWFNNNFDFELNFSIAPDGGFEQSDFTVETIPAQPIVPGIDNFSANGSQVTISVNRPPIFTGGVRWLCINYEDPENPTCEVQRACWARLPGDVNGDNTTSIADLTALISGLNAGNLPATRCDMDRSGACRAPDILTWIDIANGAGVLSEFLNLSLDACPSAP